jgi:hypothetical protein
VYLRAPGEALVHNINLSHTILSSHSLNVCLTSPQLSPRTEGKDSTSSVMYDGVIPTSTTDLREYNSDLQGFGLEAFVRVLNVFLASQQ